MNTNRVLRVFLALLCILCLTASVASAGAEENRDEELLLAFYELGQKDGLRAFYGICWAPDEVTSLYKPSIPSRSDPNVTDEVITSYLDGYKYGSELALLQYASGCKSENARHWFERCRDAAYELGCVMCRTDLHTILSDGTWCCNMPWLVPGDKESCLTEVEARAIHNAVEYGYIKYAAGHGY